MIGLTFSKGVCGVGAHPGGRAPEGAGVNLARREDLKAAGGDEQSVSTLHWTQVFSEPESVEQTPVAHAYVVGSAVTHWTQALL